MSHELPTRATPDERLAAMEQELASLRAALNEERQLAARHLIEYERTASLLDALLNPCPLLTAYPEGPHPLKWTDQHHPTRRPNQEDSSRPLRLSDRIGVLLENLTGHRATLAQLHDVTNLQRTMLNAVPVGLAFLQQRRIRWANPAFSRMFGYPIDDLHDAPTSRFYMDHAEAERVGRDGYARLSLGTAYSTEVLFKRSDGRPVWCQLTGQSIDPIDPSKGSIWSLNDVTERRHAETALRESEQRFARLVQHANDIIAVADSSCAIVSISDSVESVLGFAPTELAGTSTLDRLHPDDLERATAALAELTQTPGSTQRLECRIQHKDGRWVPLELVATNLLHEPAVGGIVYNVRDISERNHLTEQLQQAMKMEAVGRLAGGIAHDFNNLLTVISGSLELIKPELATDHANLSLLNDASTATDSAASLTRQLLAFSRKQLIEPKLLNLNELVQQLRKLLVRVIGEHISLHTRMAEGLGSVRVDPGQFEQVVVNLVVNARDAMPDGGVLELSTANTELDATYARLHPGVTKGRYVVLTVADTGTGMDAQVREHLFEPFFTTKPKGMGTGLGLATIFGAIKQSGGHIEVQSELGEGTIFRVYLPLVDAPPDRLVSREPVSSIPTGSEAVLLVEDEDSVRALSQTVLNRLGYSVIAASSGMEALALAEAYRDRIDLLMTDVVMPGMNGHDLANRLTTIHPEAKVLFTSGYPDSIPSLSAGLDELSNFISKPYAMQALATKIRGVLQAEGEADAG